MTPKLKKIIRKIIFVPLIPLILKDYFLFKSKISSNRFPIPFSSFYPQIKDKTLKTGFDAHYVYHTSWAARRVKEIIKEKETRHVDISSSLFFSGITSAFIPIDFYDYRPANLNLSNLKSDKADLTKLQFKDQSIYSLSCMHTVEHIGLGRYGDPIDPDGDLKAINELKRVLAKGGNLLFVVPIGKPKIEFNAHRIYSYEQIISYFKDLYLKEFSLVEDNGNFLENTNIEISNKQSYGCGCFLVYKKIK